MKYLPLFSLEILHDYYADQRCPDFVIGPTLETQKVLKDCRAVLKSSANGIRVMVPVAENNRLFISISPDTSFVFQLQQQNSDFPLFTDLAEMSQVDAPLYTNTRVEPQLKLLSREAKTLEDFAVQQPAQAERFVLSGKPRPGLQPKDFIVNGLGTVSKASAYEEPTKTISVNSKSASAGARFSITYPITPARERDVFAEVKIKYDDGLITNAGGETKFEISFKAKDTRWKYYVVLDKMENNPLLPTIEDGENNILFKPEDRTDLVKTPDPADRVAVRLAQQYPNLQYFRFVSKALIPCRESARKTIQLQLSGDKVVNALPNPLIQNYVLDVRNAKEEHALYHVVKYFTHPFP